MRATPSPICGINARASAAAGNAARQLSGGVRVCAAPLAYVAIVRSGVSSTCMSPRNSPRRRSRHSRRAASVGDGRVPLRSASHCSTRSVRQRDAHSSSVGSTRSHSSAPGAFATCAKPCATDWRRAGPHNDASPSAACVHARAGEVASRQPSPAMTASGSVMAPMTSHRRPPFGRAESSAVRSWCIDSQRLAGSAASPRMITGANRASNRERAVGVCGCKTMLRRSANDSFAAVNGCASNTAS